MPARAVLLISVPMAKLTQASPLAPTEKTMEGRMTTGTGPMVKVRALKGTRAMGTSRPMEPRASPETWKCPLSLARPWARKRWI